MTLFRMALTCVLFLVNLFSAKLLKCTGWLLFKVALQPQRVMHKLSFCGSGGGKCSAFCLPCYPCRAFSLHFVCTFAALNLHFICTFSALYLQFSCTLFALFLHFYCTFVAPIACPRALVAFCGGFYTVAEQTPCTFVALFLHFSEKCTAFFCTF